MRVAGFGFRASASLASLRDALEKAGGASGLALIATAADKAETPVFREFAKALALPFQAVSQADIEAAQVTTQSAISQRIRSSGSLSEAAALAAVGSPARLVTSRRISSDKMATCAIAESHQP